MANGSWVVRSQRIKKRIAIRYGPARPLLASGFTANVSPRGLAMSASSVYRPRTKLLLELRVPSEDLLQLSGGVAWALQGAPALGLPNTLGVEITTADEGFFRFLSKVPAYDLDPAGAGATPNRGPAAAHQDLLARPDRYASGLPFRFGTTEALFLTGEMLNVSADGLCFRTSRRVPVGTTLHFAADAPAGTLQGAGVVLWTRAFSGGQLHGMHLTQAAETWFQHLLRLSRP